ncbi:glycosyltransferase family 2 protein [Flexibacterium corallicola]|uniref:glycosyltransferase family 2 protein n=1 Tax=Flexibacterium corallicola TaxID=3037259 RepID=UPI00286EC57E|nr:glycosyltransferase [Pseudovibrio sp. M1P-2-3]
MKLSIIVTSYNVAPYIRDCLGDLVQQDVQDYEVIAVDDGSTDGTQSTIQEYADRYSFVRPVFLTENSIGGVATAANVGLDKAIGEYIAFADGDDRYDKQMFSKLLKAAVKHDSDLAICDYYVLNDKTGKLTEPADEKRWKGLKSKDYIELNLEGTKNILRFISVPWRKIYRKELLDENSLRFPVGDYFYEDNPFHWFTVVKANSIACVSEKLCRHRVNRVGQTMATVDARLFKMFEHHRTIYEWLLKQGLVDRYAEALLGWLLAQVQWISRKCPPDLIDELFDAASVNVRLYSHNSLRKTILEYKIGEHGCYLAVALQDGNRKRFSSLLLGTAKFNILQEAYYRFRMFGAKYVLKEGKELVKNKVLSVPLRLPKFSKVQPVTVDPKLLEKLSADLDEIKIGITILERKVDR